MNNSKSIAYANLQNSRFDPKFFQIGVVMDNRDPLRSGKLKIWIRGSQSDPTSKGSWITASYLSPFAGSTGGNTNAKTYQQYPKGYGFWAVPPDVGAIVGVVFANGNIHDAWWFGGAYEDRMNTMVPGSATKVDPNTGYDSHIPVVDYDRNTLHTSIDQKYINIPLIEGLKKQNLLYDSQKGVANRSSTRQATSTVYGLSSPRGNSFILDDGFTDSELTSASWDDNDDYQNTLLNNPVNDTSIGTRKNEGIVLRTRSGAQFLLSESDGNVFLINRDGTARFEMTQDGQIVVHCDKSITVRTDEDFNLSVARDFNLEIGRNFNTNIKGDTKLNLLGKLDTTISGETVINAKSDYRLNVTGSIMLQSGGALNFTSGKNTVISSGLNIDLDASSGVNMTGVGATLSVSSQVDCNTVMTADDFKSGDIGLNTHIHYHEQFTDASNHSNAMASAQGGGGSGSVSPASKAAPANDVSAEIPVSQTHKVLQYINTTKYVSDNLSNDLMTDSYNGDPSQSNISTYERLQFMMPCTGTIRKYGYWGKNVPTDKGGTTNNNGWIIQTKGNVCAPYGGDVVVSSNAILINHGMGYKTVIYNIKPSVNNGITVSNGDVIGSSTGIIQFEIRLTSATLTSFEGTVDPGLFYSTVTGTDSDCSGKSLTIGLISNKLSSTSSSQTSSNIDSDEMVITSDVQGIGSQYSQRGSMYSPKLTSARNRKRVSAIQDNLNITNIDKTPIDWKVTNTDSQLITDLHEFEGSISYQTYTKSYRNGKFWTYVDSRGYPTIGYGHLITSSDNFSSGLTEEQADNLLAKDANISVNSAKKIYAQRNMKLPYVAQLVLTEMCFQMGYSKVLQFNGFLTALANNDYKTAAYHMRASAWYSQARNRVEVLARRIEALS